MHLPNSSADYQGDFTMTTMQVFNFQKWIDEHRHLLQPPVCNKAIYEQDDMIIMVVGGPNGRQDFHYNEGPEFFYQIEGELLLRTQQNNQVIEYHLTAGDIFLLPPKIPHSPVRFAHSIGLVVEQVRLPEQQDGLLWFCQQCNHKLYEAYFPLKDIEKDFGAVFDHYLSNESLRTCSECGTIMPNNQLELKQPKGDTADANH